MQLTDNSTWKCIIIFIFYLLGTNLLLPVGAGATPSANSLKKSLAQRHGSYDVNKHSTVRGVCFFQLRQMVKHMPRSVLFCILQYSWCSKNSIGFKARLNLMREKKSFRMVMNG